MDRGFATSTSTSNDELKVSPTTTQQMPPGTFAPQITKPWCEALVELSQPSATDACLDLASGGGVNAFVIADAIEEAKLWGPPAGAGALGGAHNLAGSVLGLDRSREALSKAKEALKAKQLKGEGSVPVRFEWADAVDKDSPWHETKKKRFARAYCDNGMQFFQHPEEACKRVRESLIPGGAFVVSVWGPLRPETQPLFYSAYTAMAEVLNGMDNSDSWVNASRAETIAQFGDPFSWVSATDQNPNSSAIERLEEVLIKSGFDAPDAATEKASHARFENLEQAAAACVGSMSFLEKFKTLNSGDAYAQFLESFERQLLQNAGSSEVIQFEAQPGSTTVGQKGEGSFISVPATAYFAHATAPWR
ncbi:class I SAM-dependent methyltransferase [bacterium]|nr:class I SAM-dependent methyltransferase [bacterium]